MATNSSGSAIAANGTQWEPPGHVPMERLVEASEQFLSASAASIRQRDEILVVEAVGLEWEIATTVVEPADPRDCTVGADGRRVGVLILHGGLADHREKIPMAQFLAGHLGYRVSLMSYPGRFYLYDPAGVWPGDTIGPGNHLRTPVWHRGYPVAEDEYDVIRDRSDPVRRAKWGTLTFAGAREGSPFYDRLAAWPRAFEQSMIALAQRDFPEPEYSVYVHGHSTGGPFAHMILQRVSNIVGLLGAETSSFPSIFHSGIGMDWDYPFHYLTIMSWRNLAMYAGPEAGPDLQWKLPWVMEEVLERWETAKQSAFFKAEYIFTYAATAQLAEAARASARRLRLGAAAEDELIAHYVGYTGPLPGQKARSVPPLLLGIMRGSRDHTPERYERVVLPALAAIRPQPRVALVQYDAGVHAYDEATSDLPLGVLPAIARTWDDAIRNGFFVSS